MDGNGGKHDDGDVGSDCGYGGFGGAGGAGGDGGDGVDDGVDDDDHNEALTGGACYQCKSPAGSTHDVGVSALSKV